MDAGTRNQSFVLTPPGAGAIAVLRVVGPNAVHIVNRLFRSKRGRPLRAKRDAKLCFGFVVDGDERIDDVVVSHAPSGAGPAVDITSHGGVRVVERILEALERNGAPLWDSRHPAPPVWPGRNRIEQEAAHAMSLAKTARAVRFLGWQRANLASHLESLAASCVSDPEGACVALDAMALRFAVARTLLEGATVVITGPPNAGKSTLFNRLIGRTATLVSPTAGTTRDFVTESIDLDGVPLTLVDTAGREGPSRGTAPWAVDATARMAVPAALQIPVHQPPPDLSLLVLDGSDPEPKGLDAWLLDDGDADPRLIVVNKMDKGRAWAASTQGDGGSTGLIPVSAKTGMGVEALAGRILESLGFLGWQDERPTLFTPGQVAESEAIRVELTTGPVTASRWITARLIEF
ncbi:MAG: GTP-binding protein [Planctomycetes bacterium]|nr:GTP-binding protein [Planctomycetota bacterium]